LEQNYSNLLPTLVVQHYQHSLSNNITLLKVVDLAKIAPIDLVFLGWPGHGLSWVGISQ
jgi:hypothetical protein